MLWAKNNSPLEAYRGDEPYVFISYAHPESSKKVFEEINILNKAGYRIWYDEGIEASNEWPEEIAKAVIGCADLFGFYFSLLDCVRQLPKRDQPSTQRG